MGERNSSSDRATLHVVLPGGRTYQKEDVICQGTGGWPCVLEEMTTELSGKEGEAGVAQIFVGAGEDGTRGLGLPSPTGTSILHVKGD